MLEESPQDYRYWTIKPRKDPEESAGSPLENKN
jgi:hypothetical protein